MVKLRKIFFVLFMVYTTHLFGIASYPDWFLFPNNYPNTTVGYSYGGYPAMIDAERNYCVFDECIASGILYRFQDYDQKNSDYYYFFSPDSLENIKGKLNEASSFITNIVGDEYIKLFSTDDSMNINSQYISLENSTAPMWVSKKPFFQDNQYYYGIGEYQSRGNENDAWKTAEEQALFEIMTNLAVNFYSVNLFGMDENESNYEFATAIRVKYKFNNIQIMQRWIDLEKKYYFVLIRVNKFDVFSPFMH